MFYLQNFYTTTLCLAYQSLGIVYGDLSISPIYVYKSTFSGGLQLYEEDHEILGVLSMVFWTLTLIPLCKYIIFVLAADDNGEGAYSNLNYHIAFHYLKKYIVGCCWKLEIYFWFYRWNVCFVFITMPTLKDGPFEHSWSCSWAHIFLQIWNIQGYKNELTHKRIFWEA